MNNSVQLRERTSHATFDLISDAIAQTGWGVFDNAIPKTLASRLRYAATERVDYHSASVGRDENRHVNRFVRRDLTSWIVGRDPAEVAWLHWSNQLRRHLNRTLFLGLEHFESHFAHYEPGTFYQRHLDAFQGEESRKLSLVLYLNPSWLPSHGGELVIFDHNNRRLVTVAPGMATVVVFLSEHFPHEILPTYTDRYSIAGWFMPRGKLPAQERPSSRSDVLAN